MKSHKTLISDDVLPKLETIYVGDYGNSRTEVENNKSGLILKSIPAKRISSLRQVHNEQGAGKESLIEIIG